MYFRLAFVFPVVAVFMMPHFAAGQAPDGLQSILVDDATPPPEPSPSAVQPTDAVETPAADAANKPFEELPDSLPLPQENTQADATPPVKRPSSSRANPGIPTQEARSHALGVSVAADPAGVKVVGLIVGGPAAQAGIQLGDIIQSLDGQSLATPNELVQATNAKAGNQITLQLLRSGKPLTVSVVLERAQSVTSSPSTVPSPRPSYGQRRISIRTPGVRIETNVRGGYGSARVTVVAPNGAPPIPPMPPVPRRVRVAIPIFAAPVGPPPIGPPPFGPPRFRRFGR